MNKEYPIEGAFLEQAVEHLEKDFMPRIKECVASLSQEELWWRPNSESNSVGNILLHLAGNVRQWIISGVGGTEDTRIRDQEFSEQGPVPSDQLLSALDSTVAEACQVLRDLPPEALLKTRRIQKYDVTGLQAAFHVVEHFSGHTGQIIYITKLLKNRNMRFYDL